jgi:DNA-binding beta-propeller fold protein YncE
MVFALVVCCFVFTPRSLQAGALQAGANSGSSFDRTSIQVIPLTIIYNNDRGERLLYPRQVFFDQTMDELYVVSGTGKGNSIFILGADYFPYYSLGRGRGADRPSSIFVDQDGNLFVGQDKTDEQPTRLSIFNAAFFKIKDIVLEDALQIKDLVPDSVAVSPTGSHIYLISRNNPGYFVFDGQGNFEHRRVLLSRKNGAKITFSDNAESRNAVRFTFVTVDRRGRMYLLSADKGKVYVLDETEQFLFSFGVKGGSHGKLSRPRGIALDEFKRIAYVVDYMRHTVLMYDMDDGHFVHEFGGQGWSPGWFNYPTSVTVGARGEVIVADYFNNRVQVLEVR